MLKKVLLSVFVLLAFGFVFAGKITSWMDIDDPTGVGDYELFNLLQSSGMILKYVEVSVVGSGPSLFLTGGSYNGMFFGRYIHVYGPYSNLPEKGMYCRNDENTLNCLDYKVRFAYW